MRRLLGVFRGCFVFRGGFMRTAGRVMLVKLLGAIGAFEFMALARNGKPGNGHKKDGE